MKITLLISIFVLSIVGVLFTSCDDKLEVLQAYDFSVSTMPVQKRIKQGETAEIRLQRSFGLVIFNLTALEFYGWMTVQHSCPTIPTRSKRIPFGSTTPLGAPTNKL